jgi:hypothetical protein
LLSSESIIYAVHFSDGKGGMLLDIDMDEVTKKPVHGTGVV